MNLRLGLRLDQLVEELPDILIRAWKRPLSLNHD